MENELNWSFYFKDYAKKYDKFMKDCSALINADSLTETDLKKLGRKYSDIFNSLITVCRYFLMNNSILADDDRFVVVNSLHFNLIKNGYDFYDLYLGMRKLPEKNFLLPKKYISKKYVSLFGEMKTYFDKRYEKEKMYGMDN